MKIYDYKKAVLAGKIPQPAMVKAFNSLPEEKKVEVLKAIEAAKEKAAVQATAATKTGVDPQAATAAAAGDGAPNPAKMVVVARKTKGGTAGAVYQDTDTGAKWMVKFNGSEDAVRNEVLASKLYNAAGVEAPDLHAIVIEGKPALASRMVDGISEVDAATLAKTASVQEGFAVDAWLANWDVAGMHYDNTVLIGGRALRIDVGGALRYRAVGGLKGAAFGDVVGEFDSLLDASLNRQSAEVFGRITQEQLEAGAVKVLRTRDEDIRTLVARYGPTDPAEAAALADRIIARKADVARRFPRAAEIARQADGVAEAPLARPPRVTAAEQGFVEQARANGFGFKTDSGDVEDQMVVVSVGKTAKGGDFTRGWLKARPDAAARILDAIKRASGVTVSFSGTEASRSILTAIKGINTRAATGWEKKDIDRIKEAATLVDKFASEGREALKHMAPAAAADLQAQIDELLFWAGALRDKLPEISIGGTGVPITGRTFSVDAASRAFTYTTKPEGSGQAWKSLSAFRYQVSTIERGSIKLTNATNDVPTVSEVYEAEIAGVGRVRFIADTDRNGLAMRGAIEIDVEGAGVEATERVFAAMDRIGLKAVRSTQDDRDDLYLNAFARMRFARDKKTLSRFLAIDQKHGVGAERTRAKLEFMRQTTGVDVEASDGWARREGQYQAFGHGRAKLLRPDLDTPEFEKLETDTRVFHDPNFCKTWLPIWDRLAPIIDSGGHFAALSDRVRRGIVVSNDKKIAASASRDLDSGGGSYFFTRIVASAHGRSGFYWKARVLKRMDAVTYSGDLYGDVSEGVQMSSRQGQTVDDFRRMKDYDGNETIFKDSLSIFDDLDFVKFGSPQAAQEAIKEMRARGYKAWPDGRALEEVFLA